MLRNIFDGNPKRTKKLRDAAFDGRIGEVTRLLGRGVIIDEVDMEDGENALTNALHGGHADVAELLIASGADVHFLSCSGNTPLLVAADKGGKNLGICRRLLEAGANVNFGPKEGPAAGLTALYLAAARGAEELFELFLGAGADPFAVLQDGSTLMYAGAMGGNPNIIRQLKDLGVATNGVQGGGRRPIHIAALADQSEAVLCFLSLGVLVDQLSDDKQTPLLVSAMSNKIEAAIVLIANGADVSYTIKADGYNISPLIVAAMAGHDKCVRLLLDAGADPETIVQGDKTVLDFAIAANHVATVKLLKAQADAIGRGAKPKAKTQQKGTNNKRLPTQANALGPGSIPLPRFIVNDDYPASPKRARTR